MSKESDPAKQKLVRVFSTHDEMEARVVQDLLRSAGIESMITGEMLPSLYPTNMGDLAQRDILVLESEADEANRIIAEQPEAGGQTEE